jgi:hypothetical protein
MAGRSALFYGRPKRDRWTICHLVFEVGHWFFGKQSSFSPNQINRFSCEASKVFAKMTKEAILQAPEYQVPSVVAA